jgi:hypothetical protein
VNYQMPIALQNVTEQAKAEINLFAQTNQSQVTLGTNVHVYGGNVGAIMTGPGSIANVVFNAQSVGELVAALDKLRAVAQPEPASAAGIVDLIDGAKAEANSPKPSAPRLGVFLEAIASTVQTTAALEPAYQLVKPPHSQWASTCRRCDHRCALTRRKVLFCAYFADVRGPSRSL